MRPETKYVLCLPQGGFNDTLCQIWRAAECARKTGRTLLLDTRYSGLSANLFDYFDTSFACETAHPAQHGIEADLRDGVLYVTGREILALPLDATHQIKDQIDAPGEATIITHFAYGGGDDGIKALAHMHPKPAVQDHILTHLPINERGYLSVHIRNTDMATDYQTALARLRPYLKGKTVLLCSDDEAVAQYFSAAYSDHCKVHLSGSARSTDGSPLHLGRTEGIEAANLDMLTDLYSLAFSERLFMVDTQTGRRSGFCVLAAHMLRRLAGLGTPSPFDWQSRGKTWADSAGKGLFFRVWRNRNIGKNGAQKYLAHPTYE
ncbi:hypothetical protein [Pseudoprimorskyibacter insulae]|uniref:Uncharacterized protein n=1 Tax=Pseudoprimorskyibacter insulae TaxID=1695997 RepID=A0A2R8AV06_9RHOB|nr:hypothetical protein [Pseudoprimorskyibacter insulae]SPF79830.1 hypothetical protein PRI8871_01629 [Pseudoprimorskyibacter insulae]